MKVIENGSLKVIIIFEEGDRELNNRTVWVEGSR
jgi:hypothetical protein